MHTKIIAIEGLDGCGKETQSNLLVNRLQSMGYTVKMISFPRYAETSSSLVEMYLHGRINKDPKKVNPYAASMMYALDRYISYEIDWSKYIDNYDIVIFDRYVSSNITHQSIKVDDADLANFIRWVRNIEYEKFKLPVPNIEIYLTADPEICASLMKTRTNLDLHETKSYQQEVYDTFKKIQPYLPDYSKIIDCTRGEGGLSSIECIHREIIELLEAHKII